MTEVIVAKCYDRHTAERRSAWSINNRSIYVEQVQSTQPWSLYTMQTAFCVVHSNGDTRPLEVATSSHAQAIRAYCYNVLRVPRDTVIQTDYEV